MTVYEKNLRTLANHYSEMDERLEKAKQCIQSDLEVFEEDSYSGEKILRIKRNGKLCYLSGKRNMAEPARIWLETLGKLERNTPVLMMGVGNYSYLKELAEQTKNRITIVVYEPSLQIFLKFLEMVDLERWMEKHVIVFWVNGLEDMDIKSMGNILQEVMKYEMLSYLKHIILPNYDSLFVEEAVEFARLCRDIALKELSQFNTKNIFSSIMVKNLFSNAKYLCDGYKTTQLPEVIPSSIPGIVVAAGPSLNKNVQKLKKAKGKAFIVAVDTAIKPMFKAGIVPDMFAVIDAMKPLELVKLEEARDIPLLTTLNAAPEVLDYHRGKKFFFNEGYQFAERIFLRSGQKIGDVSSGGSVATNVFSFLYKIGINTVVLVGQDLAYTDNKSHADGTFQEVMEEQDTSHFMMVEGNYQDKVPTRGDFKLFIDWYNMYIEGCKKYRGGTFRVINATEGGAKIRGTEIMPLEEAIAQVCGEEIDIQSCLNRLSPMLDEKNREWAVEYLHSMPDYFGKLKENAKKIRNLYKKLDKICARRSIDRKEYLGILKKLGKEIENIESTSAYQLVGITMNNAQYILQNEQYLQKGSVQEEGKEIARKGLLYMENVIEMSKLFQEYSEEVFGEEFLEKFGSRKKNEEEERDGQVI